MELTKVCGSCGKEKPLVEFCRDRTSLDGYNWSCRSCRRLYRLARLYDITPEEYDRLWKLQKGVCAICSGDSPAGRRLSVDHDHETEKVRGLLCVECNSAIGFMDHSPELLRAAASYLEKEKP